MIFRRSAIDVLWIMLATQVAAWAVDNTAETYQSGPSHRVVRTINREWTFNYLSDEKADQAGCQAPDFKDVQWPAVAVPHTWSTYETTGELHPFIRNASEKDSDYWWKGWGWYRKRFRLGPEAAGRKVFVEFDGVQKYSKVWLNGHLVGEHKGGFTSFHFDLTPYVNRQGDNVLAVAVNNRQSDSYKIPPMQAGNWNVYGGIYRDVRLVLKDALYIPYQGAAQHEGGTFVTTPQVDEKSGQARVRTWVKNDDTKARRCELVTVIADAARRVIERLSETRTIEPGELAAFDQTAKPIANPSLWSPQTPYLYHVYSEVREGTKLIDAMESPLGFRWFHWDNTENRLYLNGKKILINGTNRHQEYPWLGDAVPKWLHLAEMADIRFNLNDNFMRTCHYPQDPVIYDFCDKNGIIINEEVPNIKKQDFDETVQEQNVREMIRRDRNHPAIFFWSMGNETTDAADSKWAHEEDPARILHGRYLYNDSGGKYITHTQEQMGMEALQCTIRGWYNEDVRDPHTTDGQQAATERHQHDKAVKDMLKANKDRKDGARSNFVTWLYADHGADREYVGTPLLHVNPKGWLDAYRYPKYTYYLWQANFAEKPMVFIHPHFWRRQYAGQKKEIVVDSNCDSVELKINGRSLGTRLPRASDGFVVRFGDVPFEAGTIEALGRKGDRTVITSVTMAGEPARLVLTTNPAKIEAGRDSAVIIKADIVDAAGVHVYGATNTITWKVSGPATLIGPEVYASDLNKTEALDGTMYIDAPVNNLIRSTGQPGLIRVTALASGLASGVVEIQAEAPASNPGAAIIEPALPTGERIAVTRNVTSSGKSAVIPQEMQTADVDLELKGSSPEDYSRKIDRLMRQRNPKLDFLAPDYRAVLKVFTRHLTLNHGILVRDDYNFTVAQFNACRQITHMIAATKLPEPFKTGLIEYYADALIVEGDSKDLEAEGRRIQAIPASGQVVVAGVKKAPDGAIATEKTGLTEIVSLVYPRFNKLRESEKESFFLRLTEINPTITRSAGRIYVEDDGKSSREDSKSNNQADQKKDSKSTKDEKKGSDKKDSDKKKKDVVAYLVEKGRPIYIPSELTDRKK